MQKYFNIIPFKSMKHQVQNTARHNYWHVYALNSLSRTYIYVGLTSNLVKRVKQHSDGKEKTTRPYRPFRLMLSETFNHVKKPENVKDI